MMRFPFFLAWRTITTRQTAPIRLMLIICCISIFIASCSFSLILAFMHGFEKETFNKLQGIHDDITIRSYGQELNTQAIKSVIDTEYRSVITATHHKAMHYTIILNQYEQKHVVLIMGIDLNEAREKFITRLRTAPEAFDSLFKSGNFLCSICLADYFDITKESNITLALPQEDQQFSNKLYFEKKNVRVSGFFQSGIEDFDMNVIFCSLETFTNLFDDGITEIGLMINDQANQQKTLTDLRLRFGPELYITSWQEMYPTLLETLKLQKFAMSLILALIILISCIGIFSLIFMLINQKRVEIAILRAHGIPLSRIKQAYLIFCCSTTLFATLLGTIFSMAVASILNHFNLITLPTTYYTHCIPIEIHWHALIVIISTVTLLSIFTSLLATRWINTLSIAQVLKFES